MKDSDFWADVLGFGVVVVFVILSGCHVWSLRETGESQDQGVEVVE